MRMKTTLNTFSLIIALLLGGGTTWANTNSNFDQTKSVSAKYSVNTSATVRIEGRYADVKIETWDQNEVEVEAILSVRGADAEEEAEIFSVFEEEALEGISASSNRVSINTSEMFASSSNTRIRFDISFSGKEKNKYRLANGTKVSVRELKLEYVVKMPKSNDLYVETAYQKVELADHEGDVKVDLYSGTLKTGKLTGTSDFELKYGEAFIGELESAKMETYEQKMDIKKVKYIDLDTKYSTFDIGQVGKMDIEAYEDKIEIEQVEDLEGEYKYGTLEIGKLNEGELEIYELTLDIEEADLLDLRGSKYSKVTVENAGTLKLDDSYEDKFSFDRLVNIDGESKYSLYKIDKLVNSLKIDAYEGDFKVGEVLKSLDNIEILGKYNEIFLNIEEQLKHKINLDVKYGDLDFPKSLYDNYYFNKDGERLVIKLKTKDNPKEDVPVIVIKGYEVKVVVE